LGFDVLELEPLLTSSLRIKVGLLLEPPWPDTMQNQRFENTFDDAFGGLTKNYSGAEVRDSAAGVLGSGVGLRGSGAGVPCSGAGVRGFRIGARGSGDGVRGSGAGVRCFGAEVRGFRIGVRGSGAGVRGSRPEGPTATTKRAPRPTLKLECLK
jgi:hypothetical protein